MTQALIILAAGLGVVGALSGNRAAYPLLASLALCQALPALGLEFDMLFWIAVDVAVIVAISCMSFQRRNLAVIALFLPAWGFYLADPGLRFWGTLWVVVLQMALTLPWLRIKLVSDKGRTRRDKWNEFDLKKVVA